MVALKPLLILCSVIVVAVQARYDALVSGAIFVGKDTSFPEDDSTIIFKDPSNHPAAVTSLLWTLAKESNFIPSEFDVITDPWLYRKFERTLLDFPGFKASEITQRPLDLDGTPSQFSSQIRSNFDARYAETIARSFWSQIPGYVMKPSFRRWLTSQIIIYKDTDSDEITFEVAEVILTLSRDQSGLAMIDRQRATLTRTFYTVDTATLVENAEDLAKSVPIVGIHDFIKHMTTKRSELIPKPIPVEEPETSPLTLPELALLIGQFLHRNDICACILVSREWQRYYEPLLYRSLLLDESTMRKLTKERIVQHVHHIRHLTLVEPMHLTLAALQQPLPPSAAAQPLIPPGTPCPLPCRISIPIDQTAALGPPPSTCRNLLSIDINPSMLFRKLVHEQIPKRRILAVGTDSYSMLEDDFWCLQSTDACIQILRWNPSLRSLTETWDNMSSLHRIRFTQLLCREPNTLVKMHLTKWEVYPEELNMLIENSPCLEHLRFSTLVIKRHPEIPAVVPTASESTVPPGPPGPVELNLKQLKALILTYATIGVSNLQIEAPELQTLCITMSHVNLNPSPTAPSSSSSFAHYASSASLHAGYCSNPHVSWNTPRLEKLVFNRSDHHFGTATLLESAYALRAISFADYEVDSRLVEDVLAQQAPQLERIRLACYVGVAAKDIRAILTRCPNLKALYAPEILAWAGDLIPITGAMNPGDAYHGCQQEYQEQRSQDCWVCTKLEMLSVYVCLEPIAALEELASPVGAHKHHPYASMQVPQPQVTTHPSRVIRRARGSSKRVEQQLRRERTERVREGLFKQLGKLTQLKHLDLSGGQVEKMDHVQLGLPMTLKGGLHTLDGLTKLEHVTITGWLDEMGREEVAWMQRCWPRLRFLSLLKTDAAKTTRLQAMAGALWPELAVQNKEWNKGSACPWTFFGH
ncbi:hypothetical protein BGZ72_008206 [Mortierella alpina]|nr:hypothetical protein BGZ72_008206 [Mortierella alpina]